MKKYLIQKAFENKLFGNDSYKTSNYIFIRILSFYTSTQFSAFRKNIKFTLDSFYVITRLADHFRPNFHEKQRR